jgi:hypothetical protein
MRLLQAACPKILEPIQQLAIFFVGLLSLLVFRRHSEA